MGKATIASGGPEGNYTITLDYGQATRDAVLAKIAVQINKNALDIIDAEIKYGVSTADETALKAAVETAINNYVTATQQLAAAYEAVTAASAFAQAVAASALSTPEELAAAQAALAAAQAAYKTKQDDVKRLLQAFVDASKKRNEATLKTAPGRLALELAEAEKTRLTKLQAYWQTLALEETRQAWCADYTEDATGLVATIEIPGENTLTLIAPAAPAPTVDDGLLTAREVQTPEQAFFNAAILPGWQKYKPTYRRGTITAIDTELDKASVTLDDDKSSAQGLGINQTTQLTGLDVVYMICHASAFEVGDRCVVKFTGQNWNTAKVVGFAGQPKPCETWRVLSGVVRNGNTQEDAGVLKLHDYKPTANAWAKALKSKPSKADWHAEELLAPYSGGGSATSSAHSGLMAKLVQLLLGYGKMLYPAPDGSDGVSINYSHMFEQTHGIILDNAGLPWLTEISRTRGVLAMRLPEFDEMKAGTSTNAVKELQALFGCVPSGATFPDGSALTAAIAAGTVFELINATALTGVFDDHSPYSASMGWSFDLSGTEAHNTCQRVGTGAETFLRFSAHYKIAFSFSGATPTASLVLVSENAIHHAAVASSILTCNGVGIGNSSTEVAAGTIATLMVCHFGDTLVKLQLSWTGGASNGYHLYFEGVTVPNMAASYNSDVYYVEYEWGWDDRMSGVAGPAVWWVSSARNGFLVRSGWGYDISLGALAAQNPTTYPVALHVVHPGGLITSSGAFGAGVNIGAGGTHTLHYSVVGSDPHIVYPADIMMRATGGATLSGTLFAGETSPAMPDGDQYYFIGLL